MPLDLLEPGMRAAPYSRVSKDRSKSQRSVERQDKDNLAFIEREQLLLVDRFRDNDRGASPYSRGARPDWQRLMEFIEAGHLDVIVVWEPSRATRDRVVWAALAFACQEHNILIAASGRVYDPNDPDDMFQLDLYFALAIHEAGRSRKRILSDVRSNAAKGRPHGKVPWGYVREYDPQTKAYIRQIPHPDYGPIVETVFERWADGQGLNQIARDLNNRRIPTPRNARLWRASTLRHMLETPSYAGARSLNGDVIVPDAWTPVVKKELWDRVQAKLNNRDRQDRYDSTVKHLLSSIPTCGVCGGRILATSSTRPAYACADNWCVGRSRPALDRYVSEAVIGFWEDDRRIGAAGPDTRIGDAEREVAVLERRLEAFTDQAVDDETISRATLARFEAKMRPKIAAAQRHLNQLRAAADLPSFDGPIRTAWYTPESEGGLSLIVKRRIIRATVTISIGPGNRRSGGRFNPEGIEVRKVVSG